ncbi:hypothetical protein [Jannaschia aquimarina]|uniref:Plant Basic Secretory Protein n=1 Tax=Jannaschia aquimarina TaxID=935700 RepID=A0A0D1ENH1_9RHOB|nr:hypothetical protein [Jannaschia aquimarina]KIT17215.1 hypothetical protein jaqu_09460 [Jannaschia aquimarina]SNT18559.1 hypothetical protein SAMN05421775_10772 [Jannaschia aquimarina]
MRILLLLLVLAACSRPLTEAERALVAPLHGDTLDTAQVRIAANPFVGLFPITFDARPRTTCRERIGPPRRGRITTSTAGIVLFETLLLNPDYAFPDYAAPVRGDALDLPSAMFFVHEMTHVWQWQNRALTGYHPRLSFREHIAIDDPYLFDDATGADFLDYGFEAQASLVEEYLCCATLDPRGARTGRLYDLLSPVLPVARPQSFPRRVTVPWALDLDGICS